MTHTPGPWDCDGSEIYCENLGIASVHRPKTDDEGGVMSNADANANARLIAAAPELHEACKHALHALNTAPRFRCGKFNSYDIASMLEHAIAKAEGRSTDNAVS